MAVLSSDLIRQGASTSTGYTIDNSCRFNTGDNPEISKTFSGAGTEEKNTVSVWIKVGDVTGNGRRAIFSAGSGGSDYGGAELGATGDSSMEFVNYASSSYAWRLRTTQQFRDPAAWYHFVFVFDSAQTQASERAKIFVNGERITSFATETYPSASYGSNYWMGTTKHEIGTSIFTTQNFDGYMADFYCLDNYAYGPEYFGEFDDNGIWIPKAYTGSYGTNGFFFQFKNSGSLGTDTSGQGNNFSTSGLQANDQRIDTPTNNQITFNPLNNQRSGGNPQNGNLQYDGPGTRTLISLTANIPSTGKWAVAFSAAAVSTNAGWQFGIAKSNDSDFGDAAGSNEDVGASDGVNMSPSSSDLQLYDYITSSSIDPSLPITTSDEFWIAVDMATGKAFLGIYDESATTMKFVAADTGLDGNPATGDNPTTTISAMIGSNDYTFAAGSKDTSNDITLLRSTEVSGTTPTGYTYFENVKDIL